MSKYARVCLIVGLVICASIAMLALVTTAVGASEAAPPPRGERGTGEVRGSPPEGVDLDVIFIDRAPLYKAYCVDYTYDVPDQPGRPFLCPGTESDKRWPDHGEIVTFTAHIVNKGTMASPPFRYAWYIDRAEVASGTLPALAPAAEITATYQWTWAPSSTLAMPRICTGRSTP